MTVRVAKHFHPIRMTCPIQPEPYFQTAAKIEESPRISLSLRNSQRERTSIRLFPNGSSLINHYDESHLVYGSLRSILLDQGILVKNKLEYTPTNFLPSFFTTNLAACQCKPLYFMLPLKPSFKNLLTSLVLLHHLYFPSTFSEGITTNEIPTLPK